MVAAHKQQRCQPRRRSRCRSTRRELVERALATYAEADRDIPEEHRAQFEQWLADHPTDTVAP